MYGFIKRVFDVVVSLIGIIVTLPIWIIAIVGILISDPGPIFYIANRVGKDNKPFNMFKFRSMRVAKGANEKNFKADENRIFPFGNFIRRTKIDELPQLLNILFGHMSVVGPRPAAKDQLHIVRDGKYTVIAKVIPGLTGPGAIYDYIYGDSISSEDEYIDKVLPTRLELEVYYIKKRNVLLDLRMIWHTAICVLCSIIGRTPQKIVDRLVVLADEERKNNPHNAEVGADL